MHTLHAWLSAVGVASCLAISTPCYADLSPVPVHPLTHSVPDSTSDKLPFPGGVIPTRFHYPTSAALAPETLPDRTRHMPESESRVSRGNDGAVLAGCCLIGLGLARAVDVADILSANSKLPGYAHVGAGRPALEACLYILSGVGIFTIRF